MFTSSSPTTHPPPKFPLHKWKIQLLGTPEPHICGFPTYFSCACFRSFFYSLKGEENERFSNLHFAPGILLAAFQQGSSLGPQVKTPGKTFAPS